MGLVDPLSGPRRAVVVENILLPAGRRRGATPGRTPAGPVAADDGPSHGR